MIIPYRRVFYFLKKSLQYTKSMCWLVIKTVKKGKYSTILTMDCKL